MSSSRSPSPLPRRLSRPIFVAVIVAVFTMVTVGSAEASILDDLKALLQRAQQAAAQQPAQPSAPAVTGGIAGQIGSPTGTTPPPSQIGYVYFSNSTSDGSGTAAQLQVFPKLGSNHCALPVGPGATANHDYVMPTFGCKNDEIRYMGVNLQQLFPVEPNHPAAFGMDLTDYRLGITVSLWDSKTCGATNHPFAVIKLGGDDKFIESNIEFFAHDIEHTYGPELDRVTRGGGKGQLAGKISCVRIERNSRLS